MASISNIQAGLRYTPSGRMSRIHSRHLFRVFAQPAHLLGLRVSCTRLQRWWLFPVPVSVTGRVSYPAGYRRDKGKLRGRINPNKMY